MVQFQTTSIKWLASLCITSIIATMSVLASGAKKDLVETREASVYIIKDGDYLGGIAISHGVSIEDIIDANGLDNPDKIYSGMELMIPGARMKTGDTPATVEKQRPKKIFVEVPKGFTLTRIAKAYEVSVAAIVKANANLSDPDSVRAGMEILIPGATKEIELVPPPPCYNPAVEFYRVRNNETVKIHLTFCNGKPNPAGVDQLSRFSSPLNMEKMPFPLHPRLAVLLQKVADEYPNRRLEIVSGQRLQKRKNHESLHNKGQAIDFRVAGIPNRKLVNFVRQFDNTGVGFYPNSVFIHMDTRQQNAFWIDYSRPGERAIYARAGMTKEDIEKIREARAEKRVSLKVDTAERETPSTSKPTNVAASVAKTVGAHSDTPVSSKESETKSKETSAAAEIASLQGAGQA
ncbi:MAG: LysM peptidoglycan-binding domain-containing protein [Deltaproteobacteria bacterium]|nr:LysM peptidoglycan-binding domain-containing protein [Deltaproteobacteria bacterium]